LSTKVWFQPVNEPGGPERPLSIMHLCAPAHVGGLERVVQGLVTGQAGSGHRVAVVAVVEPGADTDAFLAPIEQTDAESIRIEVPGRGYLREIRRVGATLSSWRPDVLHTHGYRSDLLHGVGARRRGVATVTTLHGSSRMGGASHLFEWIQVRALKRFDAVVAVSDPLRASLVSTGLRADRLHLVPNAWTPPDRMVERGEARRRLAAPEARPVIGWVGRLIPIKGCDVFVEALASLTEHDWVARVVGDGPERPRIEALARRLGLQDRVAFLGAIPDAARLFEGLDLFVLSSRSEGTPMVLLEAMGASLPVVATEVGGVPGVVRDGSSGWLVPSEDRQALAAALEEALLDPELRRNRAEVGAHDVRTRFGFDGWIRRHEAVYRSALRVRNGHGGD